MNRTAVFDHWHRRYLVIIYSSNKSADREQGGGEGEQMKTYRETESALISVNKGAGQL